MYYSTSFLWKQFLEFEIELLEKEKMNLLEQLNEVNSEIHHKYDQLANVENISSVKICLKDLLSALRKVTNDDHVSIKIYALSSLFKNKDEKEIDDSSKTMNYLGSEIILFFNDQSVIYSHLHLFDHVYDLQLDGKTLMEHSTIFQKGYFQDLVVNKDIDHVVATFILDEISPNKIAKTNDQNYLLEQAIFQCILSDKVIEYHEREKVKTL